MSASGQRICKLAERASAAASPDEALQFVRALREEIDDFERQHVARALTLGEPVTAIARALGVSRQSAHRRFRDLVPPRLHGERPQPTPEVKLAVEYARGEARRLRAPTVAGEHLLLGILRLDDCAVVQALNVLGITSETARPIAQQVTAARLRSPPLEDGTRAILAAREPGFERVEDAAFVDGLLNTLSDRERIILRLRFEEDITQAEIGARLGISQMHVSRVIRQAITTLQTTTSPNERRPARLC